jgi:hypothetical protein
LSPDDIDVACYEQMPNGCSAAWFMRNLHLSKNFSKALHDASIPRELSELEIAPPIDLIYIHAVIPVSIIPTIVLCAPPVMIVQME